METYRTKDGQVVKYVHDDGSETAIKTVSSCANVYDKDTGKIVPVDVDREKFSMFISSSVGCPIGCKFCYLAVKKFPYHKLSWQEILANATAALDAAVEDDPLLKDKYMKLSWMGMGDAFLLDPRDLVDLTYAILIYAQQRGYAKGLDGVDISTVYPTPDKNNGWPYRLGTLNDGLTTYKRNPHSEGRSPLRLFYSYHHSDLIPGRRSAWSDLKILNKFSHWYGVDLILHHMFLGGINDSKPHLESLEVLMKRACPNAELRILRYNECPNSPYKESERFDELVAYAAEIIPKVKHQVSAGSEIKAACGQFLCVRNEKGEE